MEKVHIFFLKNSQMNERLARKYIGMLENLYENNLELVSNDSRFYGVEALYLYRALD